MNSKLNRRRFIDKSSKAGAGAMAAKYVLSAGLFGSVGLFNIHTAETAKPVKLGGKPVRQTAFPAWPIIDETDEKALIGVLKSGHWFRGSGEQVNHFEAAYAKLTGAKHCIATANGTSALVTSLSALRVQPGDEVIVPPYTFVATVNAVMMNYALPVFVDTDPETFQMDARKVEAAISERTTAIIPVHLGGNACDLDSLLATAGKHKVALIEDACQAHLGEWRGSKVGTFGAAGCFSFQASKNLNSGEGGAVLTNDDEIAENCFSFQNNCRARKTASYKFAYRGTRGANLRLTEFQGALLLAQMKRLEKQAQRRDENGKYLEDELSKIRGIAPAKRYGGCTRNAYHLFMFRYQKEDFAGLPRSTFISALGAEGIPCSSGYSPLNKESFIQEALKTRAYQRAYPADVLRNWVERTKCPANDRLCEEAVWFAQTMLLGTRQDMDDIVAAVRKIQAHATELAKA